MRSPLALNPGLSEAYWASFEGPERERQERSIEVLEEIKTEHGPGWAIYASAFFHGHEIRAWRRELIAEIEEALS